MDAKRTSESLATPEFNLKKQVSLKIIKKTQTYSVLHVYVNKVKKRVLIQ